MAVIEELRSQTMPAGRKEIFEAQLTFLKNAPEIFAGFKAVRADFLKHASLKEVAVIKPEHCQHARLDDYDLASIANVLQQHFTRMLRLSLRGMDETLRQRGPAIRRDFRHDQIDPD